MACLRYREGGGKIDDEIALEVAHGDLVGVGDKLTAAEDAGTRSDEGDAELEDEMGEVEEVGDGAEDGDATADEGVDLDADGAADVEEVEVEGIDEEGDEAGDEEDTVPPEDDVATGVEDAPGLPWFVAVEADGDGGSVEWKRLPAKGEEETGGGGAEGAHRPRRGGEASAATAAAAMGEGVT